MKGALSILADHWQAVLCMILAAAVLVLDARLDASKAELQSYQAVVTALGDQAEAKAQETNAAQRANLEAIKENHDDQHVEKVRAGAVAAFRRSLRPQSAGGGEMPGIAARVEKDDGPGQECAAAYVIVANAAEDADTLSMWQEWARRNKIPVVE